MESSSFLPLMPLAVPTTAPSPVAARALDIGELVEHVLCCLPPADILRCRRVSRTFCQTVTHSRSLRQQIFLESDASSQRLVNPLAPAWFEQQQTGYRDSTIAARINIWGMWSGSSAVTRPLWDKLLIAQPPATQCVIPVGNHSTVFFSRSYPNGMTFGDLERAVISAFEIRRGKRYCSQQRLEELYMDHIIFIYWG